MRARRRYVAAGIAVLSGCLLAAVPSRAASLVVRGATIHPVSVTEAIPGGVLVVEDGRITAVGAGIPSPAGATVVEANGLHLYPGFVHPLTQLGLIEIESVRGPNDTTETGEVNSHLRAEVAFNADSMMLPPAIAGGVTTAHVFAEGGLVSGTSAVLSLAGWNWRDMTLRAPVGMHVFYPRQVRDHRRFGSHETEEAFEKEKKEALERLDRTFDDARAYDKARAAASDGKAVAVDFDPRLEALRPVVAGALPVFLHAGERTQIGKALDWAAKQGLRKLVLVAGADAQYLAERLAKENVAVILDGVLELPGRAWEPYDAAYAAAAKLHAAGVRVAIADHEDVANARNLPFHAAMAAAFGLPKEVALRAITLTPAEILGVADRVGSLEPGKDADFFLADGDPLEIRTHILRVWIRGEEVDFSRDRQRQLHERYRSRPKPAPH